MIPYGVLGAEVDSPEPSVVKSSNFGNSHALDNWYFGPTSAFAVLAKHLSNTIGTTPPEQLQFDRVFTTSSPNPSLPAPQITIAIFGLFANSINLFYPTIVEQQLETILIAAQSDQGNTLAEYDQDLMYLIVAIGSRLSRQPDHQTTISSQDYFHKATHHPERSRDSWIHADQLLLLQRHTLICIYLLLNPAAGDLWRNLGFAIRSYFDLAHSPSTGDMSREDLTRLLFRTIYSLEW